MPALKSAQASPSDQMIAQLKNLVPSATQMDIPYDDIYMNRENNVRFKDSEGYNEEELKELAASIEGVGGLLQAVGVVPIEEDPATENKPYMLLYGYRRFIAWGMLREEYPAEWKEKPINAIKYDSADSDAAVKVVQMMENYHRKDLNSMEVAAGIQEALGDGSINLQQKQIAELFGISESAISQHLKLLQLPPSIQEDIRNGSISFSAARDLVNRVPADRWLDLAKVAKVKTYGQFSAEINRLFSKPTSGGDEAATVAEGATAGEGAQQKQAQLLRATEIANTYIPFVKRKLDGADGTNKVFTAKDVEQARLDTLKTVTRDGSTALAKDIAPFIEEQEKKAKEDEAREEALKAETAFYRMQARAVEDIVNAKVDLTDPNAKKPTPAEAIAMVATKLKKLSAEDVAKLGFEFKLDDPEFFSKVTKRISDTIKDIMTERKEAAAKREEKKKKDEAAAAEAAKNKPAENAATPAATKAVAAAAK